MMVFHPKSLNWRFQGMRLHLLPMQNECKCNAGVGLAFKRFDREVSDNSPFMTVCPKARLQPSERRIVRFVSGSLLDPAEVSVARANVPMR